MALGNRLADEVIRVLNAPMEEITGPVQFGMVSTQMPVLSAWTGSNWIETDAALDPAKPLSGPRRRMARMAQMILDSMDSEGHYKVYLPGEIWVVRIGDRFIHVAISEEICSPVGLRIKDQLRGNQVMVSGYVGYHSYYFPGQEQISAGGYEVFTNPAKKPFSPEAEDMLVCDAMDLIQKIGPKIPSLEPKSDD